MLLVEAKKGKRNYTTGKSFKALNTLKNYDDDKISIEFFDESLRKKIL